MKPLFAIFVVMSLSFFISCGDGSSSRIRSSKIIHEEVHLGEYMQVESPTSLISVQRDGESPGIVRINLKTDSIEVLDPSAKDARDIRASADVVAYRVGFSLKFWKSGGVFQLIDFPILRLRGLQTIDQALRVYVDTSLDQSMWLKLDAAGNLLSSGALAGSLRANLLNAQGEEVFLLQETNEFSFWKFESEIPHKLVTIETGKLGSYAAMKFLSDGSLWAGYFDETAGTLKAISLLDPSHKIHLVDGIPGKTYRGHDIAIFDDQGKPGFVCLDAWSLKIRMARMSESGIWTSEDLGVKGALGFYNQILDLSNRRLKIATHYFRTDHEDRRQSFENLGILEIQLDQLK